MPNEVAPEDNLLDGLDRQGTELLNEHGSPAQLLLARSVSSVSYLVHLLRIWARVAIDKLGLLQAVV